jgi:hypothetical protein
LAQGGVGASANRDKTDGGGGGGGGYYSGGGGQASAPGFTPGGGGGGGSNYRGGSLSNVEFIRGGGGIGNGRIILSWKPPTVDITPPPPPSNLNFTGLVIDNETPTRIFVNTVNLLMETPETNDAWLRPIVRWGKTWDFSDAITVVGERAIPGVMTWATLAGLAPNTLYYVRAWLQDPAGHISESYNQASFWTNRPPEPPELVDPSENRQFSEVENITFNWKHVDPDDPDAMRTWEFHWRQIPFPGSPQTEWQPSIFGEGADLPGNNKSIVLDAGTFQGNRFYEWTVRTMDGAGVWGDWARPNSLYVISETMPPRLTFPINDEAAIGEDPLFMRWVFVDPEAGSTQQKADLRYRAVGTIDWITLYGEPDPGQPGPIQEWVIPNGTFQPGYRYEWSVRTYNEDGFDSDWAEPKTFWAVERPGTGLNVVIGLEPRPEMPPLGCGVNRFFIYDRGGEVFRGELTPIQQFSYGRKRDDISSCTLALNGFGKDCGELLSQLRTWMHEIVVFRDGKRVWEGPISRIDLGVGEAEIEAKDVMNYVYRRIMRQGYNDTAKYHPETDSVSGGYSVVKRATSIVMNCLAYDDPNVLKWMTALDHSDDAIQHRAVPDYSKMAWEEIDDMAAHAGLDYTVSGRRIMFWDTHRPIGRLPEMRDGHFSEPPRITEYGMQLANHLGTTNGQGVYGVAERGMSPGGGVPPFYGWVEQLISAYGETEGTAPEALTRAARAELEQVLARQSDRNIAGRWPAPVIVRVPDNAYLNPDIQVSFDHLIPGVWIPVRAVGTVREVAQWQKLDSVTVTQQGGDEEKIAVVMSPAPNDGLDPDADAASEEG